MRRYWLSILMAVLAVSGIATYYSYGRLDFLPDYKLETIQGDAKEGAVIELSGSQYLERRSEALNINFKGSEYYRPNENMRKNVLSGDSWFYKQPDIKQMIKDHKSFMRGKLNAQGFYRDEEWVVYAEVKAEKKGSEAAIAVFQLQLLEESTDKVSKLKVTYELPKAVKTARVNNFSNNYMNLVDVQKVDEEIHLLVSTYDYDNESSRYEIFVIDMKSRKLLRNTNIESLGIKSTSNNKDVQIQIGHMGDSSGQYSTPLERVLFIVSEEKISQEDREANKVPETLSEKYYAYSYRTGLMTELTNLVIKKAWTSLQGDEYYVAESGPEHITLSRYHLSTNKFEQAYAKLSAEQLNVDEIKFLLINSNRVYVMTQHTDVAGASVLDLATGELLYTGRVVEIGNDKQTPEELKENLHLNNLEIVGKING